MSEPTTGDIIMMVVTPVTIAVIAWLLWPYTRWWHFGGSWPEWKKPPRRK